MYLERNVLGSRFPLRAPGRGLFCFLATPRARPSLCRAAALLLLALPVCGQDALRMSLASAEAARVRREANTKLGYYNLNAGPTAWRFSNSLGLEWNDNVEASASNPLSDFIVTPGANAWMHWPLTDRNTLNLQVGAGYAAYVRNPGLSRVYINPGSELSFDLYTGNLVINLHDRFSINQYSYQDPTVAGVDYSRLENALGPGLLWDLNKVILRAGYDHINYVTLTGGPDQPDGQSEVVYTTAGYKVSDQIVAGLEAGGGTIRYNTALYPDAVQWNAGAFSEAVLSEYILVRGSAGYTIYSPDQGTTAGSLADLSGLYFQFSASHRVNQYLSQTISAGRTINLAFYGGSVDRIYVSWAANWNIIAKTTLSTSLEYQTGEELNYSREEFDWFGGGITLGRQLTRKVTTSLAYHGYWRDSDLPDRGYVVNSALLQLRYDF